ncbi:LOW QUALITY PROTEIN: olfactory receptor 6J1 [Sagmatias obliquidens]|uniref:LOW QUALITY PROTEIN: olfactory receptor 6J1 n=1 Tax=Sagmatias obliquidens TaxID=3371155 RepID=UPI000F445B9F|nr:LOW QUALITY PROTEIN: olfactory receptor 49 [Lagenorhynchus obliquidens]
MQHSPFFPINSKCPQIPRTSRLLVQHTSDWPSPAEVRGAMGNHTTVTEFVLLGLSDACELQMLIFLGLLLTCLFTLLGNLFVVLTLRDRHLHTPMYYFLRNFAILEIWFTLVIFPKMLSNILTRYRTIFLTGCFLQFFLYFFLGTTEFYRLAVMSFDRYVAICKPLRYVTIMSKRVCVQLVLCSWMTGFLIIIVPSFIIFQQPFCGPNIINHFFCDNFPLLELICVDTSLIELLGFILANFSLLGTLSVKATCYGHILHIILQNPSAKERQKAFSTCFSHITVVSLFYGSCIFMYVQSGKGGQGEDRNNVVALLNTMVTPMFNPFIYTLRNKQVKQVFREQVNKLFL